MSGVRNWRGESVDEQRAGDLMERRVVEMKKVFRKDEFGRDVEVCVKTKRLKRETEEEEEKKEQTQRHKHKKQKRQRDKRSSRLKSFSPRGRLVGTPPPPDPFRPQLDEGRDNRPRRRHDRNRSRSRSCSYRQKERRSPERVNPRCRSRDSSWNRSRSRGRKQSRSPPLSRSHRRRSSASVERKWTHSAFTDRSPSPPRELDPLYRPEPEAWVSRAGGVYLPRKT